MLRSFLRSVFLVVVVGAVSACTAQAPVPKPYLPSFKQFDPIVLNVGKIEVVENYTPTFKYPNVEHTFAITPSEGVKLWTRDRLQAAGGENSAEVIINDASVVEKALPRTSGIKGAFTNDQSERYDGKIAVEIRIYEPGKAIAAANVNVEVSKSRTIAENASLQERETLFNTLNDELLQMLNKELEKNITAYFGNYLTH